ncbi:hypothetical protein ILUMI_11313 [Ignelater luminosus]|uniref:Uncharacterized protein n=1 Tax=Ignelater luminosus TaxID=2038154 RepID=A0A8K0D0H3_IGNLU|nr:hypothetical protein ILUMI_11313 [Ignelater luminosus]
MCDLAIKHREQFTECKNCQKCIHVACFPGVMENEKEYDFICTYCGKEKEFKKARDTTSRNLMKQTAKMKQIFEKTHPVAKTEENVTSYLHVDSGYDKSDEKPLSIKKARFQKSEQTLDPEWQKQDITFSNLQFKETEALDEVKHLLRNYLNVYARGGACTHH